MLCFFSGIQLKFRKICEAYGEQQLQHQYALKRRQTENERLQTENERLRNENLLISDPEYSLRLT